MENVNEYLHKVYDRSRFFVQEQMELTDLLSRTLKTSLVQDGVFLRESCWNVVRSIMETLDPLLESTGEQDYDRDTFHNLCASYLQELVEQYDTLHDSCYKLFGGSVLKLYITFVRPDLVQKGEEVLDIQENFKLFSMQFSCTNCGYSKEVDVSSYTDARLLVLIGKMIASECPQCESKAYDWEDDHDSLLAQQ